MFRSCYEGNSTLLISLTDLYNTIIFLLVVKHAQHSSEAFSIIDMIDDEEFFGRK